ncbi:ankyrin repeat-containing domain protein [Nemania abortiva]|nr:ankyrin repeat-containing domain protein [Nemania abortiva]
MTTQLPLDILWLISEEITIHSQLEAALNFSLVSRSAHDFTYPLILKADALTSRTQTLPLYLYTPRYHEANEIKNTLKNIPSSLRFFIESDNAVLVATHLKCTDTDVNTVINHPEGKFVYCDSLLSIAVDVGAVSVAEFILKLGGKFHTPRHWFYHPLGRAVDKNDVPMTKFLLEYGLLKDYAECAVKVHFLQNDLDRILIGWFVDDRVCEEMARTLIAYCSNPNERLGWKRWAKTAIHCLVDSYDPEAQNSSSTFRGKMETLVQAGADVDAITTEHVDYHFVNGRMRVERFRRTALNTACSQGSSYPIQVLLELGASAQGAAAFNIEGDTIYFTTNYPLFAPTALCDLISHGILRGEVDEDTLLKDVKLLLDYRSAGLSPSDEDRNSEDIVAVCANAGKDYSKLWAFLIDADVFNVYHRNQSGQTILSQLASCEGDRSRKPYLASALIKAGADPNSIDDSGMTPLLWAISRVNYGLIDLLLEHNARPS